jgi:hypothetical protein
MRGLLVVGLVVSLAAPAAAQPKRRYKPGDVKDAKLVETIKPLKGFVDDGVVFDGAGGRLVYINSDSGTMSTLKVLDIGQKFAEIRTIDLSSFTTTPTRVELVPGSESIYVAYRVGSGDDATIAAALVDSNGKVKRKFGPATDVRLTTYEGDLVVVTYDVARKRTKKGEVQMSHTVEVRALESGKRVGKKVTMLADDSGYVKKLDFKLQYWQDDYLTAVGIKGGQWDRKQDQRSPDSAGRYDIVQRLFAKRRLIKDVTEHALRVQIRAEHPNEASFLRVTNDLTAVQWVTEAGEIADVEFAEPFHHYDPKSLRYQLAADGGMYFSLTIDPVNPDAVGRKKADPKWLDLYRVAPGKTKAKRLARLLVGKRDVEWVASAEHWAVLQKHVGFSRGGTELDVYKLK